MFGAIVSRVAIMQKSVSDYNSMKLEQQTMYVTEPINLNKQPKVTINTKTGKVLNTVVSLGATDLPTNYDFM
jgi:hypothetical protein